MAADIERIKIENDNGHPMHEIKPPKYRRNKWQCHTAGRILEWEVINMDIHVIRYYDRTMKRWRKPYAYMTFFRLKLMDEFNSCKTFLGQKNYRIKNF